MGPRPLGYGALKAEGVSRHHLSLEATLSIPAKNASLPSFSGSDKEREGAALSERLDDQHPRHHRVLGKVAPAPRTICVYVDSPAAATPGSYPEHPVHEQERVPVRDHRLMRDGRTWLAPLQGGAPRGTDPSGLDVGAERRQLLHEPLVAAVDMVDVAHLGLPVGAQRSETSAAPPRRSGLLTGAPESCAHPFTSAWCPSMRMSAPMRPSSSANMKRFSKTFSVMSCCPRRRTSAP